MRSSVLTSNVHPGKGQALHIPSITICHENPYKSTDKVGEMVKSGGYDDNTFDLFDLVTNKHTSYSVQPVSIVLVLNCNFDVYTNVSMLLNASLKQISGDETSLYCSCVTP